MHVIRTLGLAALTAVFAFSTVEVDAKRLGGGRSVGAKRDTVSQQQATPPSVAPAAAGMPAAAAAPVAAKAAAPAAAQPSGFKRFLPMLGGLAIGAALASMFGGGAFGSMMSSLLMMLAVGAVLLLAFRFFKSRSSGGTPAAAGAGYSGGAADLSAPLQRTASEPQFGGASNRPVELAPAVEAPIATSAAPNVPAGFDVASFSNGAKAQFNRLQAAFDKGDAVVLKDMLTDEMYAEVDRELKTRGPQAHPTEVITLNAEVIEVTTEADGNWASVRFHGMLREDGRELAEPFDEVWNLHKAADGSTGWLLAGIQQLIA
jgi:predicted lipid-binding transport protein (Tim44 family)